MGFGIPTSTSGSFLAETNIKKRIELSFTCKRCGSTKGIAESLRMSGAGLSRLLDWQHHKYIFVSCQSCGYTEVFNEKILGTSEKFDDILDLLWG
jgi:predicted nucleic-acid-binding Zn-ribbon protein